MMKGPDLQVVVSVILTEYPGMEGGDTQGEKREAWQTRQLQSVEV